MLTDARLKRRFADDAAAMAVERIMSATLESAGALIAVANLKEKDAVTFLHSIAVSALMIAFGRVLGHREERVRLLGLEGLVHNLGKVALPEAILSKFSKLTAEEMMIVREHPQGATTLFPRLAGFHNRCSTSVAIIARDTMAPAILTGERKSIPYVARIAAICDVYEALTTISALQACVFSSRGEQHHDDLSWSFRQLASFCLHI
ncbi:HD-GYP domain-containing protein [Rhizobium sp. No.120]